ncbi:M13 family metallopeptidase [Acinetobacter sp. YH16031]|uniref:M13 family metallopeptidase n=1 Tax=Acinetobacter sp. YH16031 TaxID=2601180 RepID=UPI0035A0BFB0
MSTTSLKSAIDLNAIDRTVDPKQDFYQFVNGNWLKTAKIPEDQALSGAFAEVSMKSTQQLFDIFNELAKKQYPQGSNEQKVADLYASYMDTDRLEQLGLEALQQDLQRIESIKTKKDLAEFFAYAEKINLNLPFSTRFYQDRKASSKAMMYVGQGGLGMPDRDFYLSEQPRQQEIRNTYLLYIANTLNFAGQPKPIEDARTILALEKALAKISWSAVELRNDEVRTYLIEIKNIIKYMPSFDWMNYFSELGLKGARKEVAISQINYLRQLDQLWKVVPIETWQTYLKFNLINSYSPFLTEVFQNHHFEFYDKTLEGVQARSPRNESALKLTNGILGNVLGKLYVEKHFNESQRPAMLEMVENVRKAFHLKLDQADWMGSDTKKQVRHKLDSINIKIGYPKTWRDYSALEIRKDDLIGNIQRTRLFNYQRELDKVGEPIDPEAWHMSPQTANAYYNVKLNEIVLPAAIWQAPFYYDDSHDPAVNYGAIGAVIAHEISHGFDDRGSRFDAKGKGEETWNERDRKKFNERTKALVEQYKQYEALPGHKVNAELNKSENISDNLGLGIAHMAYKLSLKGQPAPVIDGFSGDQRFYMGWAQVWRSKSNPEYLLNSLNLANHAPGHVRGNGAVRNQQSFYEAFGIKEGDKMYLSPEKRISIW